MSELLVARPLVIAHRGGAQLRLENTLPAFQNAFELGADGIELDVHLSQDGQVIVYHDYILNPHYTIDQEGRPVQGEIPLRDLTLAEIKSYALGKVDPQSQYGKDHPYLVHFQPSKIPTLDEVLDILPASKMVLIEIKSRPEDEHQPLVDAVVNKIQERQLLDRALVISFNWKALDYLNAKYPNFSRCYLSENRDDALTHPKAIPPLLEAISKRAPTFWGPDHYDILHVERAVLKNKNLKVIPWTVNDIDVMETLVNLEVHGITTDRPDLLIAHLEKREIN
ncbi:Glycerophosphoryl diester phosphodiesterase [Candidatus Bealeia paramacronuclearis]|uniref:Glycerophosphoryl diester phosphodiesterase n=1 Tax=Candidatus Bealeia paramacronuclearis TaxID=1921001 RepID=A0ABZ2CAG6_9PROT|nr:Glycerophosphoryl diester phosphodiesterase [Candidatus Bealeia paramacronuclearis]